MFCHSDRRFQGQLNKTYTELLNEFWDNNFNNALPSTFQIFNAIFLLVTNSLWIRGLLKTNRHVSLPVRLNLLSGVIGLSLAFLETLQFLSIFIGSLKSCWTNTISATIAFMFVSAQVFVVITSSVVRYIFLVHPLKPVNRKKVYVLLFIEMIFSLKIGSVLLIGDFVVRDIGEIEQMFFLGQAFLIIITCLMEAVLIVALQKALSRVTIANKAHAERHSKAIKRLIFMKALGILLNSPFVAIVFYYFFGVNVNGPTQLIEMDAAFEFGYFLMTSYNGFVPLINLMWNQSIRNYYKFKRREPVVELS